MVYGRLTLCPIPVPLALTGVPICSTDNATAGPVHSSVSRIPSLSSSRSQISLTLSPSVSVLPEAAASQGSGQSGSWVAAS
ncbi:hypothetical protein L3X37_14880 [Sabulilitoribacter arenilitoris]|uniref:Uncharacterized protein n=1 Tax=Wocania arenilitoris TaxID=2044858 RepID=A0AAE3EQ72_9FLAO|nr:hypothetical protein [Wocania arenilitoris]MCF7569630.1 hypothetical protein [Wocania arenilitoris]